MEVRSKKTETPPPRDGYTLVPEPLEGWVPFESPLLQAVLPGTVSFAHLERGLKVMIDMTRRRGRSWVHLSVSARDRPPTVGEINLVIDAFLPGHREGLEQEPALRNPHGVHIFAPAHEDQFHPEPPPPQPLAPRTEPPQTATQDPGPWTQDCANAPSLLLDELRRVSRMRSRRLVH